MLFAHLFEKHGNLDKQKLFIIEVLDPLQSYFRAGNVRDQKDLFGLFPPVPTRLLPKKLSGVDPLQVTT